MAKILITSDWHYGLVSGNLKRSDDIIKTINEIVDIAIFQKVDYFIHAGDVFHRNIVNQELSADILDICQQLKTCKIKSFFLIGNHDEIAQKDRGNSLSPIKTVLDWEDYIHVVEQPFFYKVEDNKYFYFCPHTSRAKCNGVAPEELVLNKFEEFDKDVAEITVFAHAEIHGAVSGTENVMLANKSYTLPNKIISDARVKKVFCGHIHKHQEIGDKVVIIGAPIYVDASEVNDKKGVLIYNV